MADIFPRIDWGKHDTTLIFMVQKDCTTRQIAEALGGRCTRNAVIGRIHRLRLDGKLDLAPVKRDVPRQTMHQVPGLPTVGSVSAAPVPVVEKREGRQNPDKRIYKERQRQATNHAFSVNKNTQARIAALSATPLQERFAEGFDGQVGRVSLRKLEANHCRFPIDMPDGKIRYCGLDNLDGSSFCADHHARCYVGIPKPKANPRPLKLPNFTGRAV